MTFSIRESLKFGWQHTKAHSGLLFKVLLTLFALQVMYAIVSKVLAGSLIGLLGVLALSVAEFVVGVGLTLITLRIAQGKHVEFAEVIPPFQILWRYFLANLLVGLIVFGTFLGIMLITIVLGTILGGVGATMFPAVLVLGMLAGFVSLLYISVRYSMVRFAVLDGNEVTESLKRSSKITKEHMWHLLGFLLVVVLLNILGVIAFIVGLLVTIPVTMIAYAHIYQKLHAHHASH